MSHAAQYSNIDTDELQKLLELTKDSMIKLSILSELKKRSEAKIIVETIEISKKLNLPNTACRHSPLPNLFLRSNLFSAGKTHGKIDKPIRNYEVTCYQPNKERLLVTAYRQFDQLDLDLVICLIEFQNIKKSHLIEVTLYELSKKISNADGKQNYLKIKEQLILLRNATLQLTLNNYTFVGGIINNAYFDDEKQIYIIELNPKLQPLFLTDKWTSININIRSKLKSNLAKWLHGFYSSHKNSSIPIKAETLYTLCGASVKRFDKWVELTLEKALKELQKEYENNDKFFKYELKNNLLYVKKSNTKSQIKNINKTTKSTGNNNQEYRK